MNKYMDNKKITIIGSGRRIQQDVIPVLINLGFSKKNISIFSKRKKRIFVRDSEYVVKSIKLLNYNNLNKYVYIAIPPNKLYVTIKKILKINSKSYIIVDTPIINNKIVNDFNNKKICVAEDAAYIFENLYDKNKLYNLNCVLLYKSAFSYHGIAFIESVLSNIIFQISFLGLYIALCKKGVAVIIGSRNYEKGSIYLNFNKIPFPKLKKSDINLIGGLTDIDSVSYRFLDLKRLGLKLLISNFIRNSNQLIKLDEAFSQYKKSLTINYFSITLKKIIKRYVF